MKMLLTDQESAFISNFNNKVEILIVLKNLLELNILSANGVAYKAALQTYITANLDQWVELQTSNNP
jgi:hypothetical protein